MKKLILLMAVVLLSVAGVQAQKKSKADKAADKAKIEAENKVLYKRLFTSQNFVFVPNSWQTRSGERNNVTHYAYTRVRPDAFQVDMPGTTEIDLKDNFTVTKNEETKTGFLMVIEFEDSGIKSQYNIVVNAKTGRAAVRISNNREEDRTYTGQIREN